MHDCLGHALGSEQVEIADCYASEGDILAQLEAISRPCADEGKFVFYFAGHSWRREGLQLVIADEHREGRNWTPATWVAGFIKDCPALRKPIIVDSREAAEDLLAYPGANVGVLPRPVWCRTAAAQLTVRPRRPQPTLPSRRPGRMANMP